MLQYDAVIFDLDGTLTNSERGIVACVRYALDKMNRPVPDADTLRKFIGPPLSESFRIYCGMNDAETEKAVRVYRERYLPIGWAENAVYPGIRALLKALKNQGASVYVATGKPQTPSERILRHFELMQYIDGVAGPTDADPTFGEPDEFDGADCPVAQDVPQLSRLLLGEEPKQKGYFITMEGLDGCGKTTQANAVEKALREYGFTVRRTREPGGCPISEKIRDLLLDVNNKDMSDIAEALLYAASRAQHVQEVILPAMKRGEIVLCDRFVDSSVAFQGGGRQLGVPLIQQINAPAIPSRAANRILPFFCNWITRLPCAAGKTPPLWTAWRAKRRPSTPEWRKPTLCWCARSRSVSLPWTRGRRPTRSQRKSFPRSLRA